MAASLKFTVGITNKFSGLDIDDASSDEETKIPAGAAPASPATRNKSPVSSATAHMDKVVPPASTRNAVPSNDTAATKELAAKSSGREVAVGGTNLSNKFRNGRPAGAAANAANADDSAEFAAYGASRPPRPRGSYRHDGGGPRRGGITRRREFDRQSGTGRGREMKKEGGGRHNWGTAGRTLSHDESKGEVVETVEVSDSDQQQREPGAGETAKEVGDDKVSKEAGTADKEEPFMMNMAMWKEQQAAKRAGLPKAIGKRSPAETGIAKREGVAGVDEHDARQRKTLNLYEYLYESGGNVELFKSHRNRGRRSSGGDRSQKFSRFNGGQSTSYTEIDPPDLQDSRAFPSLGNTQVLS